MNFLDGIFEHCSWRNLTEKLVTTISSNFFEPLLTPRLMTHDTLSKIETLRNIATMLRGVKTIRFKQEFAKFLLKGKTNEKDSLWSSILMNVSSENKELSAVTLEVIYLMVSTGNWEICGLLFSLPLLSESKDDHITLEEFLSLFPDSILNSEIGDPMQTYI